MSELVIPKKVFDQHITVLGKTRSGKSSAMRYLVEHLLDESKPVCIVDPKGDWWGIKSSATGKSSGYPVTIFGGEHGDLPLNASSGSVVAELASTENRPCLIDLGGWMPGDRTRFWIDFASSFFRMTRGQRWLVIDEVHNFCPKGKIMDPNAGKMLHWSNRLASEGLGKGVAILAASQRPQKVHNDFLTSCETLVGMRVIHKADRDAIKDWIDACGDIEKGKEVLNTIASRGRGEAWVYSPEIKFGPEVVKFPMFRTYDSFKPQDSQHPAKLKGWAEVDLAKIKSKLESVVKEAEANDPAKLKARIVELQKQIRTGAPAKVQPGAAKTVVDSRAIEAALARQRRGDAATVDRYKKILEEIMLLLVKVDASGFEDAHVNTEQVADAMKQAAKEIAKMVNSHIEKRNAKFEELKKQTNLLLRRIQHELKEDISVPSDRVAESNGDLMQPQMKILKVLAEFEALGKTEVAKATVAALSGARYTSSSFTNNLGALRTAGYIEYPRPSFAALTARGRSIVPVVDAPSSSQEMLERSTGVMNAPQAKILRALFAHYPHAVSKEQVAELVGASFTSSSFTNNLGALRTAGMVDYPSPGLVQCAHWLFI